MAILLTVSLHGHTFFAYFKTPGNIFVELISMHKFRISFFAAVASSLLFLRHFIVTVSLLPLFHCLLFASVHSSMLIGCHSFVIVSSSPYLRHRIFVTLSSSPDFATLTTTPFFLLCTFLAILSSLSQRLHFLGETIFIVSFSTCFHRGLMVVIYCSPVLHYCFIFVLSSSSSFFAISPSQFCIPSFLLGIHPHQSFVSIFWAPYLICQSFTFIFDSTSSSSHFPCDAFVAAFLAPYLLRPFPSNFIC